MSRLVASIGEQELEVLKEQEYISPRCEYNIAVLKCHFELEIVHILGVCVSLSLIYIVCKLLLLVKKKM